MKNSLGRASESGHACPCGASVKWPLSDDPPRLSFSIVGIMGFYDGFFKKEMKKSFLGLHFF
jgi:hypothetical protein